jgi:Cu/Ag efflux pump CusA
VIGRIVGWSLRSRGVVVVLAAALLVFGATQLRDMPVDVLPEFTPPRVEVQTEALGLSAARVQFPLEYHTEVLGDQADQRAAERRVLGVAAIAAVLVLLLMQAAFASWRPAAAVFLTLPAALVGGVVADLAGGGVLSLGSLVGLVLVLAVATRNAILLVSCCQQLARGPDAPTGPGLDMAAERLGPVLLTAVAIALAVVPLAVRGAIPGHEIVQPMALVVLGSLVTATPAQPVRHLALYLRFGSTSEKRLDAAQ